MPKKKSDYISRNLTVRLKPDVADDLDSYAATLHHGRTSALISHAITDYVSRKNVREKHLEQLRQSYADAADDSLALLKHWAALKKTK